MNTNLNMNNSLKLTITWLMLVVATVLTYFVAHIDRNIFFIAILTLKKFLLIGFIYLEGYKTHLFYKMILICGGLSLLLISLIFGRPGFCS